MLEHQDSQEIPENKDLRESRESQEDREMMGKKETLVHQVIPDQEENRE